MFKTLEELNIRILSSILDLSSEDLLRLATDAPRKYHEVEIEKNNKKRIVEIPNSTLKKKQKILLKRVLYHLPTHPQLFGGPGTSIKNAVADHVRKPIVITMDIKNFFPSVKSLHIKKMFRRRKASEEIAKILARLTTYKNHLPHGAPTSPCIGRLILNPLAINLQKMFREVHLKAIFSIYVDDITISGPERLKNAIPTIYQIIRRLGFDVNKDKTNVMSKEKEQVSLNIRLNERIEPTTNYIREVEELSKKVPSSHPVYKGKKAFIDFLMRGD